ncbi:polyprenyl diphosphate synthase [Sphingomonas sp. KRR8]|uniref:polyprenyl diphosphate synthase n=1 Tax=Sphingomonas sp. KRR8 TaxID=2942996 RepID=UPI0024C49F9E|nr:polyprenyl diphosphate synthase [Sphingomonas sp. KRR8]
MTIPATPRAPDAAAGRPGSADEASARVPRHVAIIMDGNGRWAERRGLPRVAGHRAGAEAVRNAMQAAVDAGVECLTIYAFSSENWRRSEEEVSDLKGLLRFYVERELATLQKQGVRLKLIGEPRSFGDELFARLERAVEQTRDNKRLTLVVALNYGSQAEIAAAARQLAERAVAGDIVPADIDEQAIADLLQTRDLPPLDLVIRTSGEVRLSNFLLWQAAYAELIFTDVLWPDFDEAAFGDALADYARRQRRFGGR